MNFRMSYRAQLVKAGEVELIVTDEETSNAMTAMIDTVAYEYPDKWVIEQCRQNDPRRQRYLFTDEEAMERILSQPHPWQEELDIIDTVYLKLLEDIEKTEGYTEPMIALIDEMHTLYYKALAERPHPDNPYVTTWTSGGVADD